MSKVDDVFGPIAPPLIAEWGQPIQLIVKSGAPSYDIDTGTTTETTTTYNINAVIAKLDIREVGGLYQANDVKIIFDPKHCLLYTSPSPRDRQKSRMPSSA